MPGEFMTLEEAAKFLNMSPEAVRLLAERGFTRKSANGKMFVKSEEIRDWLNRRMKEFDVSTLDKLEKNYDEHFTMVYPLLDPNCVKRRLIGTSKTAVIGELVDLLVQKAGVDKKHRNTILNAVIERERMCSTALVDGIAIPHPREPLKGIIKKSRIVLGLSWSGVDFESFDGNPTHAVVLLCTPRLDLHLHLLARLSRLLRNPAMRVALCRAKDEKAVVETFAAFEKELVEHG